MTQAFTHLRAHTEYSLESTLRINEIIENAKADGQAAVAMTDLDGFFGAIRFYQAARYAGLKPIIGTDIQVAFTPQEAPLDDKGFPVSPNPYEQGAKRVLLIAKDYEGYLKIMRLTSLAYTTNLLKGKPVIKEEWLKKEGGSGIICLSGTENGPIGAPALDGNMELAKANAKTLKNIFGDNFFIETQRRGAPTDQAFVESCVSISDQLGIPLVATHPLQFSKQEDFVAHELKVCDVRGETMPTRDRSRDFTPHQHFHTTAQMKDLFRDLPDAVANAEALATSCSLTIPLGVPELPEFDTGTAESLTDYFVRLSNEGLQKRMKVLYPNEAERMQKMPAYKARLEHEMKTIKDMGFEGYFMIVYDFINWAHEHEIPVGAGRGSGAGSLVAYSLGITDLDPLHYNLIFERFLNPERVSMPDFDIDFCVEQRELVINYVTKKYGAEAVAGITAINKLAARAAVKAAGRALGMNPHMVQGVCNIIPNKAGTDVKLSKAITDVPEVIEKYNNEPEVKRLLDAALKLEGLPKAIGRHAAGIVIARGRIADYSPVYVPEGETKVTTQYDKDDLEKAGLVKFDFLGLKNLTMLDKAVKLIRTFPGQEKFDTNTIPLDDPEVYKLFQNADTKSVFQFESAGIRKLLRDAKPSCIEDLTALNALFRPGPIDLIDDYVANKANPSSIAYIDKRMEPILKETYGIMVYQEQVMQMAQILGGYTLGAADNLRRAMGKKKHEEMVKQRQIFVAGAAKNGISAENAEKVFAHMEKFAGYGFNKSHSAAYSVIAYHTAYVKHHFPAAFFAAVLSVDAVFDSDELQSIIKNAKEHGLKIHAPDINSSEANFSIDPTDTKTLRFGLNGIKGAGIDAIKQIIRARTQFGEFTSLEDFLQKCAKSVPVSGINQVNKTVVERLIMAGSFDKLHESRAETIAAYPIIVKYNDAVNKRLAKLEDKKPAGALDDLFAMSGPDPEPTVTKAKSKAKPKVVKIPAEIERYVWPTLPAQTLMEVLENEKKAFGFYFSNHPMNHYKDQLGDLKACETINELSLSYPARYDWHLVAGVVSDLQTKDTAKGKMLKATISDGNDSVDIVAWAETYATAKDWLKKDTFALFSFEVKEDKFNQGSNSYVAQEIRSFSEAQMFLAETLHMSIPQEQVPRLKEICKQNPGTFPISLFHPTETSHERSKEPPLSLNLSPALLDQIKQEFAPHVKIGYPKKPLKISAPKRNNYSR